MSPNLPVLASVCGLYCGACTVYLAAQEDSMATISHADNAATNRGVPMPAITVTQ